MAKCYGGTYNCQIEADRYVFFVDTKEFRHICSSENHHWFPFTVVTEEDYILGRLQELFDE